MLFFILSEVDPFFGSVASLSCFFNCITLYNVCYFVVSEISSFYWIVDCGFPPPPVFMSKFPWARLMVKRFGW